MDQVVGAALTTFKKIVGGKKDGGDSNVTRDIALPTMPTHGSQGNGHHASTEAARPSVP